MIDRLTFWVVLAIERLCRSLSVSGCVKLARVLSILPRLFASRYDRLIEENWRHAFGQRAGKSRRRELWQRMFANLLVSIRFPTLDRSVREASTDILGAEHFTRSLEAGRGVVLVTGHLGAWEILAQMPERFPSCRASTLFQPLRNRLLDRWVRTRRGSGGVRLLSRAGAWRTACERLRKGEVVAVFSDQHAGRAGIWTPFFGKLASTSPLCAMLALRTGAALVPAAVETVSATRWAVRMRPPIDASGNLEEITRRINLVVEEMIRSSPSDWFWVHERWKTPNPDFLLSGSRRTVHVPKGAALKPFRILVRAPNWLGDAVMHLRLLASLKAGRPDAHLSVLCPPKLAGLFRECDFVDDVVETAKDRNVFKTAATLRKASYDVAVLIPASWRVVLEAWLGGVGIRAGYRIRGRGRLAINLKAPIDQQGSQGEHQSARWLRALVAYGGAAVADAPSLARKDIGRVLGVIAPGAEYGPAKRWPAARFVEAAKTLADRVDEWVVVGAAADAPACRAVASELGPRCRDMSGKTSIAELIGILRSARIVLSNDSGVMHLAAACGAPVVAIFTSTEPALTRPVHNGVAIARRHVPCSPCFQRECPLGHYQCLDSVKPADVVALATALMGGASVRQPPNLAWMPQRP